MPTLPSPRSPNASASAARCLRLWSSIAVACLSASAFAQSGITYVVRSQVNVNSSGLNITGDAANEPSLCLDPRDPSRIAVGWRQFDAVTNDFRQAGWGWSTNGGIGWTFPGVLERGTFRSDPVLAADAEGTFYYLGVLTTPQWHSDLFKSTNGGVSWQFAGLSEGGDKEWMAIDTTAGPGRGNIYQAWSPSYNYANNVNAIFTRSTDGGGSWLPATSIPNLPYWGTLAVGPDGEVYVVGWDGTKFWACRSTNAPNSTLTPVFDTVTNVNLGGALVYGAAGVNPDGLLGQPWIAVDHSSGPTRGNVYILCSVVGTVSATDVMFARSTDRGSTWSAPLRLNDDAPSASAYHWLGTLSVAPNGRLDACWYDTRNDPTHAYSELYYARSEDGGVTWSANMAISEPFNHTIGYPMQQKMGDYMGMVSLNAGAFIAYAATFNGEEDIWFTRVELPVRVIAAASGGVIQLSWESLPGRGYFVETTDRLEGIWSTGPEISGTGHPLSFQEVVRAGTQKFYRVVPAIQQPN